MSLAKEVEGLINDIGRGLTESAIRNRLLALQERAEAPDTALEKTDAALADCNSALHDACADLERLKADTQKPKQDFTDDAVKALRLFFEHELGISQVAGALGMSEGMAEYHCGVLEAQGLIAWQSFGMMGVEQQLYITQKGREYLVSRGLV